MAGKFSRSWALMKASAAVLQSNKSLLVFPLLSSVSTILVAASFVIPVLVLLLPGWMALEDGDSASRLVLQQQLGGPSTYAWLFAFYLVQYFVIFFFQTALTGAALMHLRGERTSASAGFALARSRWATILGYALIAATVGQILRMLQERLGIVGRLVIGFIGLGWTVATFLVVPILASEDVGPIDAVKQSVRLLKRCWGEALIGNAGIRVAFFWFQLMAVVLACVLVAGVGMTGSVIAILLAIVVAMIGLTVVGLIGSTLHGIYAAALFRYADSGAASVGFNAEMLGQAFRTRAR